MEGHKIILSNSLEFKNFFFLVRILKTRNFQTIGDVKKILIYSIGIFTKEPIILWTKHFSFYLYEVDRKKSLS